MVQPNSALITLGLSTSCVIHTSPRFHTLNVIVSRYYAKQQLEDKASELSRQVDVSVEMLASLKQDLVTKEDELTNKQQ